MYGAPLQPSVELIGKREYRAAVLARAMHRHCKLGFPSLNGACAPVGVSPHFLPRAEDLSFRHSDLFTSMSQTNVVLLDARLSAPQRPDAAFLTQCTPGGSA